MSHKYNLNDKINVSPVLSKLINVLNLMWIYLINVYHNSSYITTLKNVFKQE